MKCEVELWTRRHKWSTRLSRDQVRSRRTPAICTVLRIRALPCTAAAAQGRPWNQVRSHGTLYTCDALTQAALQYMFHGNRQSICALVARSGQQGLAMPFLLIRNSIPPTHIKAP